MSDNTYSLEKLAWLSRCLFPKNFYDELMEMGGVERDDAIALSGYTRTICGEEKRGRNILEVYQVCISDDVFTDIIDTYCEWWFKKNDHIWRK